MTKEKYYFEKFSWGEFVSRICASIVSALTICSGLLVVPLILTGALTGYPVENENMGLVGLFLFVESFIIMAYFIYKELEKKVFPRYEKVYVEKEKVLK